MAEAPKKVIVIEDEQILGDILLRKLRSEGYDAEWEINGEKGLERIRASHPDLVLLDIVMPKKDGYEVLTEMHGDEVLKKIPVVVISNSGQPVEVERILALGAKDYIIKAQFSPEEVMDKVKRYLKDSAAVRPEEKEAKQKLMRGLKILIVEDDPFLASLSRKRLEQEGFATRVASDGEQGLKAIADETPDLILLDIIMPVMNGFDALKKMKADEKMKNIPVIIFSNLGQEHEIEEGKQLGADDFLVKARFTLREVVEKIEEVLKRKGKL